MENNNPLPLPAPLKLPNQNSPRAKVLLKAFSIEVVVLFFVTLIVILFLNYFNIIPISKNVNALAFLPHETYKNTAATTAGTTNIPLPTPTPFSHKIADVPDDNSLIPIFSPDKEHVIFETPEGHDGYVIPDCTVCNNLKIALAAYNYVTGKLLMVGVSNDRLAHIFNDGKEIQILPQLGGLTISKNGQKLATWDHQNGYLVYYVNNSIIAKYPDPTGNLRISDISFSIDASKNGYILNDSVNKTSKVFIEGKEQPYQGRALSYAPQGDSFAYIGTIDYKQSFMVVNGNKHEVYSEISHLRGVAAMDNGLYYYWSPDGKRVAYVGKSKLTLPNIGAIDKDVYRIVLDGQEVAKDSQQVERILFSPDSKRFAYFDMNFEGNYELVLDGNRIKTDTEYNYNSSNDFYFSPNSKRFVYVLNGNLYEYLNGISKKLNGTAGAIINVAFSPDSQRIAYIIERQGIDYYSIDGKEYKGLSSVRTPVFSPDSKHVAYWEGDVKYEPIQGYGYISNISNKSSVVLDTTIKTSSLDIFGGTKENGFMFSPSRVTTYMYMQPYNFITEYPYSIKFTDDSKFMKYNAIRGNEYWVITIDTTTGKEVLGTNTIIPTDTPDSSGQSVLSSPTPTPASTSLPEGKEIAPNVTATVTKFNESGDYVNAQIQLKNSSSSVAHIKGIRFQLHSNAHGESVEQSNLPDELAPNENKSYLAMYKKLPEKPYILKYFKDDGTAVELARIE